MLFSYGYGWQQNQQLQKMQANRWWFWLPCCRGNTAQCALPNGAHPWLHAKPLDATIGQVPAPYCPGGHHGWLFWMKKYTNKTQFLPSFLTVDQRKKLNNFGTQYGLSPHVIDAAKPNPNLMPLFELKSSATFWAIKHSYRTNIWKVINLEWSQKKTVGHIWP